MQRVGPHRGAVAFIHRFGSSLNEHVHFHCCVIDGVSESIADTDDEQCVVFHAACGLDPVAIADVQAVVRQRILRAFVRRALTRSPPWCRLRVRIYEALPLSCPICHSQMRIIAFINDAGPVNKILDHIGESTRPPPITPAPGPPLWEATATAEQARNASRWDSSAQPEPQIAFDQRIAW